MVARTSNKWMKFLTKSNVASNMAIESFEINILNANIFQANHGTEFYKKTALTIRDPSTMYRKNTSFCSLLRSKLDLLPNFQRGKSSASYSCRVSSPSSFTNTHVRFSYVCVRTKLAALSPLLRHETNALSANHRGPPSIRMMITMTITMTR